MCKEQSEEDILGVHWNMKYQRYGAWIIPDGQLRKSKRPELSELNSGLWNRDKTMRHSRFCLAQRPCGIQKPNKRMGLIVEEDASMLLDGR